MMRPALWLGDGSGLMTAQHAKRGEPSRQCGPLLASAAGRALALSMQSHALNCSRCAPTADEDGFLEEFGDESAGMTPQQVKALQVRAATAGRRPLRHSATAGAAAGAQLHTALCCSQFWGHGYCCAYDRDLAHMSVQEELRPILLRRMKEDVETLPEKEEVGALGPAAGPMVAGLMGRHPQTPFPGCCRCWCSSELSLGGAAHSSLPVADITHLPVPCRASPPDPTSRSSSGWS